MTTAIVPHAQSGVNAPTATLVKIETLGFANRVLFSFSVSICTFNIEAVNMARLKGIQLWTMLVKTVEAISASKPGRVRKIFSIFASILSNQSFNNDDDRTSKRTQNGPVISR